MSTLTPLFRKARSAYRRYVERAPGLRAPAPAPAVDEETLIRAAHPDFWVDGARNGAEELDRQLRRARASWMREMADYRNPIGLVEMPLAPALERRHLERCRVLPNRDALLGEMRKGGVMAEVGVQTGRFSRSILSLCRPAELHLIDIDLRRFDVAGKFPAEIAAGVVHLREGDSSTVLKSYPAGFFDVIYVDGDHSYEGVRKDIGAARTRIRDDGYLIFNDYTYWSPAECARYGVIHAVNELCLEEDWEMAFFALAPLGYCDVALRRSVSA